MPVAVEMYIDITTKPTQMWLVDSAMLIAKWQVRQDTKKKKSETIVFCLRKVPGVNFAKDNFNYNGLAGLVIEHNILPSF